MCCAWGHIKQNKQFHSEGNLTQEGKGQWKLEEKQRMKGRGKEKEKLLGWPADVILRRMEQKVRRKWGANNSPLSLSSPSLAFSVFKVFIVTSRLTLVHTVYSLQCVVWAVLLCLYHGIMVPQQSEQSLWAWGLVSQLIWVYSKVIIIDAFCIFILCEHETSLMPLLYVWDHVQKIVLYFSIVFLCLSSHLYSYILHSGCLKK